MQVNREHLLACLNMVSYGLSKGATITQSASFVFDEPWIVTFNDEVSVRTKCELEGVSGVAVPAKHLIAVLTAMSDESIDVSTTKKEMILRSPQTEIALRLEPKADPSPVDAIKNPPKSAWQDLPDNFCRCVGQVCDVTGTNEQEFLTIAVHLTPQWIEASDRKQSCRFTMELPISRKFMVRSKSLRPVAALDVTRVAECGDWLHFRNQTLIYSVRRHIVEFPDLSKAFSFRGEKTLLPKGAVKAGKIGAVFSTDNKDNDKVLVQLKNGVMQVRGQSANGRSVVTLECDYRGPEISFWIGPQMLEGIVTDYNDCEIGPTRLAVHGEGFSYVVALSAEKEEAKKEDDSKQQSLPLPDDEEADEGNFEEGDGES